MSERNEHFVEYSVGATVGPWAGSLEDESGETTGFVTLNGDVWRESGAGAWDLSGENLTTSDHTQAWNSIKSLVRRAEGLVHDRDGGANYYPKSPVACLVSLALNTADRLDDFSGDLRGALRTVLFTLEDWPCYAPHSTPGDSEPASERPEWLTPHFAARCLEEDMAPAVAIKEAAGLWLERFSDKATGDGGARASRSLRATVEAVEMGGLSGAAVRGIVEDLLSIADGMDDAEAEHPEIDKLARYLQENHPSKIGEGSAVDAAIALLGAAVPDRSRVAGARLAAVRDAWLLSMPGPGEPWTEAETELGRALDDAVWALVGEDAG